MHDFHIAPQIPQIPPQSSGDTYAAYPRCTAVLSFQVTLKEAQSPIAYQENLIDSVRERLFGDGAAAGLSVGNSSYR